MKRLLMVLTVTGALGRVASADTMEPPAMSACNGKKPGDACHVEGWRGSPTFDGVCDKDLICVSKDEKKKPPKRSTLGVALLALSAGSLEILRRKRRAVH